MKLNLTCCAIILVVPFFSGCAMDFSYDESDFASQPEVVGEDWETGYANDDDTDESDRLENSTDSEDALFGDDDLPADAVAFEVAVSSSLGDAEETVIGNGNFLKGNIAIDSTDLELTNDADYHGSQQIVGLRFFQVPIPHEASIEKAYVEFVADASNAQQTSLRVALVAADNAAVFSSKRFNLSARPQVDTVVEWINVVPWFAGLKYKTPDLASALQEVVNRPGWRKGNAVVVLVKGTGFRKAVSFDRDPVDAAKLHVVYR